MIICNSKRFIFIHIPKCGGTTISHHLEQRLLPQDVSLAMNPHDGWQRYLDVVRKRYNLTKHSTAREVAAAMGPEHFSEYFVFAFVRNPFSRAYSAFTFTKSADAKHRPDSERYKIIKDMDFEQFLGSKYMQEKSMMQSRDQRDWIEGAPSKVEFFRLETVQHDLSFLLRKFFGVRAPLEPVAPRNFSAPKDAWRTMTPRAQEMVIELYRDDFEAFGYPMSISSTEA